VAYATFNNTAGFFAPSQLRTINLATGATTLVGTIGGTSGPSIATRAVDGFSLAPAPPTAGACGTQAETEPNNTTATANPMTGNRMIGQLNPVGDFDYFRIDNVPANSLLFAHTDTGTGPTNNTGTGTTRDTVLRIFAADGTTELEEDEDDGTANGGDGTAESQLSAVVAGTPLTAGGTYFIEVSASSATAIINQYNLFIQVVPATPATAEVEPNNTSATATPLVLNQLVTGTTLTAADPDFFSVNLTAGNIAVLSLDGDPERNSFGPGAVASVNHQLALVAPDGTTVLLNANSAGTTGAVFGTVQANAPAEAFDFAVTTTGTYFVRVITASTTGEGTYRLAVNQCPSATTAASASVSGTVLSSTGKPLSGVTLTLSDGSGVLQSVRSERNGSYRFNEVATGQTYVLEARSKRFTFSPQVITVNEDLNGVDFIASP
jgi:hypothetical protein